MKLYAGQATQHNDLNRYAKAGFSLKEYVAEPGRLPKLSKLRAQRLAAPPGMQFSVVLSAASLDADAEVQRSARRYGLRVLDAVKPEWVVIRTGPNFRPGSTTERQLADWVSELQGVSSATLAWEPRGLWEPRRALRTAESLGVHLVRDPRQLEEWGEDTEGAATEIYLRWLMLGNAARVNEFAVEDVVARLVGFESVFLIAEGQQGKRLIQTLKSTLIEWAAEAESFGEDEDEDGDGEMAHELLSAASEDGIAETPES